ncbi:transmembrane protein 216 isoform X1 [Fundulus heteroclitus]|uniref:transmembrane protein 216 isoform X1 n=1 Tax=Fundulus heteroclitus TaxID=8078 RepID=UPI00165B052C|nr:transmembrane protein 216 isoform X1 [Fundulus heteroclitus]
MAPGVRSVLSSTPLQVLLYLNTWYFAAFYLAEILMFIYKGILLPYPLDNLVLDVVLLLLFLALETLRIFYGLLQQISDRLRCFSSSLEGEPLRALPVFLRVPLHPVSLRGAGRLLPAAADLRPAAGVPSQRCAALLLRPRAPARRHLHLGFLQVQSLLMSP